MDSKRVVAVESRNQKRGPDVGFSKDECTLRGTIYAAISTICNDKISDAAYSTVLGHRHGDFVENMSIKMTLLLLPWPSRLMSYTILHIAHHSSES